MPTFFQTCFGFLDRKDRRWACRGAVPGKRALDPYRNMEWISLSAAAQRMYDGLDGTPWRAAADREPTAEARLDYMALLLARNAAIEGRTPPSRSHRRIEPGEFDTGVFKGGGKHFQRHYESYLTFIDLRVREEELQSALERLKAGQ